MVSTLIERWHHDIHTFHLPVDECVVTLEDVAIILGLLTNGLPVTGVTMSNHDILDAECFHQFGVALKKADCRGSVIKLT
ncbi:Serine/threonine protein phosphatase 7 long form isogeny [Arachis hypogaea]|nr:Serine/threonine protein phosphatase 7 long form isogeny [Arachis hypogaea]